MYTKCRLGLPLTVTHNKLYTNVTLADATLAAAIRHASQTWRIIECRVSDRELINALYYLPTLKGKSRDTMHVLLAALAITAIAAMPQGEYHHGHANAIIFHKSQEIKQVPVFKDHEHHEQDIDYYAHPKYEYAYEIKDTHTHDIKQQQEHRDGDTVKGEYSFLQPDGVVRTVKYYADKKTGFHADVKYEGHAKHAVPEHRHH